MINELKRQKRIHGLSDEVTEKELQLLKEGMPIQKIIGFIQFDDVKILVNERILIPRYETEEVMLKALEFVEDNSDVLDMCSGTGYIGLSIKKKRPSAKVTLADLDDNAIKQSKENAKLNDLDVNIIKSNMFDKVEGKFDVIVSNPPYIPEHIELSKSVTEYEPEHALFAGVDGNDFYRVLIKEAPKYLKPGGTLVLEISEDNTEYISSEGFEIIKDINEKDRIAVKRY